VGSERSVLLAELDGHCVIAPDNGLLTWAVHAATESSLRRLNPGIQRPGDCSSTFHGRDIFAWVAARLAGNKESVESLSSPVDRIEREDWPVVESTPEGWQGQIIHVDRFGNLITNLPRDRIDKRPTRRFALRSGTLRVECLVRTYADVPSGHLAALWGSSGMLEVAARDASAAEVSGCSPGAPVYLEWT
jgi:S-adenosylmethionine hydrolase